MGKQFGGAISTIHSFSEEPGWVKPFLHDQTYYSAWEQNVFKTAPDEDSVHANIR